MVISLPCSLPGHSRPGLTNYISIITNDISLSRGGGRWNLSGGRQAGHLDATLHRHAARQRVADHTVLLAALYQAAHALGIGLGADGDLTDDALVADWDGAVHA